MSNSSNFDESDDSDMPLMLPLVRQIAECNNRVAKPKELLSQSSRNYAKIKKIIVVKNHDSVIIDFYGTIITISKFYIIIGCYEFRAKFNPRTNTDLYNYNSMRLVAQSVDYYLWIMISEIYNNMYSNNN